MSALNSARAQLTEIIEAFETTRADLEDLAATLAAGVVKIAQGGEAVEIEADAADVLAALGWAIDICAHPNPCDEDGIRKLHLLRRFYEEIRMAEKRQDG